jgi:hypothetical protein
MNADSGGLDNNAQKILRTLTLLESLTQTDPYRDRQLFFKFIYENVIKKKNITNFISIKLNQKKNTEIS